MKSIRLSKQLRLEIIQNISEAYNKTTPPPAPGRDEIDRAFARDVYDRYIEDYIDEISQVPSDFINTAYSFQITIGGQYKYLYLYKGDKPDYQPMPKSGAVLMQLSSDAEEVEEYENLLADFDEWSKKKNAMISQATAIIDQVNTTKQLVETWAEVEPMIPEYIRNPSKGIQLPAVLTESLNNSIGLTQEDK